MQLQQFNGGLNTKDAEHLLAINEAVVLSNIDNSTGELKPEKALGSTSIFSGLYGHFFEAYNGWTTIVSTEPVSAVEWSKKLYRSAATTVGIDYPSVVLSNGSSRRLGIEPPAAAPTVAVGAAGVLTGTYNYIFTYYDTDTGFESAPSPVSADLVLTAEQASLSVMPADPNNVANKKRIYRVGGSLTAFSLVATIDDTTTTYVDNTADSSIPGNALETSGWLAPVADLKYFTEYNGMLFGAVNNTLYVSVIGKFFAFPAEYQITIDTYITGIAKLSNLLIVFTKTKGYAIFGDSPITLSKTIIFSSQGCINHHTIGYLNQALIWVSKDGICSATSADVNLVSMQKLKGISFDSAINAVVYSNVYYLQLGSADNYDILAFDARFSPLFKRLALGTIFLTVGNNLLLGRTAVNDFNYKLFDGSDLSFTYKSPKLLNGSYNERKSYDHIYIRSTGDITVKIYIDSTLVLTKTLSTTDTHDLQVPQLYKNGYSIQFEISGTGTVKEISYAPFGKAN